MSDEEKAQPLSAYFNLFDLLQSEECPLQTPVFRLPQEIITYIFHFVAHDAHKILVPDSLKWIAVTHVCRQWRTIALDSPTLWTRIPIKNVWWRVTMLERSKSAPLVVNVTPKLSAPFGCRYVPSILDELSRIRHLHLHVSAKTLLRIVNHHLNAPAPMLESFSLSFEREWDRSHLLELPGLFSDTTPRLRSLHLGNCGLPWQSKPPLCRGLTKLVMTELNVHVRPTFDELADVLKANPLLETLCIRDALPNTPPEYSYDGLPIEFVHLKVLDICDRASRCELLLQCLKLDRELTILRIALFEPYPATLKFPSIVETISTHVKTLSHRHLSVSHRESVIKIQAWSVFPGSIPPRKNPFHPPKFDHPENHARLDIYIDMDNPVEQPNSFVGLVDGTGLLSDALSISLSFDGSTRTRHVRLWRKTLSGKHVTSLRIHSSNTLGPLLAPYIKSPIWPELSHLVLKRARSQRLANILVPLVARNAQGLILQSITLNNTDSWHATNKEEKQLGRLCKVLHINKDEYDSCEEKEESDDGDSNYQSSEEEGNSSDEDSDWDEGDGGNPSPAWEEVDGHLWAVADDEGDKIFKQLYLYDTY